MPVAFPPPGRRRTIEALPRALTLRRRGGHSGGGERRWTVGDRAVLSELGLPAQRRRYVRSSTSAISDQVSRKALVRVVVDADRVESELVRPSLRLQIRRRFGGRAIVLWILLYAAFVAYVVTTA